MLSDLECALVWASGRGGRRDDGWEEGVRALAQFVAPRVSPAVLHERRELVGASATSVTRSLRALEKWSSPQQRMFAISFHMGWNLLSRTEGMLGGQGLGKHCRSCWGVGLPRHGLCGSARPEPALCSARPLPSRCFYRPSSRESSVWSLQGGAQQPVWPQGPLPLRLSRCQPRGWWCRWSHPRAVTYGSHLL